MNFQDLLAKMKSIDESSAEIQDIPTSPTGSAPTAPDGSLPPSGSETPTVECGDDMEKPTGVATSNAPQSDVLLGEKEVDECGLPGMSSMPSGMMGSPKQSDSVTMNVSMNGSGAGGIRDLMDILRNLDGDKSSNDASADIVLGVEEDGADGNFTKASTEPDPTTYDMDAVLPTGDDMHSKGREAPKVNGGGNALAESLMARLSAHYQSIKERQ
jgi:hypothetical protein